MFNSQSSLEKLRFVEVSCIPRPIPSKQESFRFNWRVSVLLNSAHSTLWVCESEYFQLELHGSVCEHTVGGLHYQAEHLANTPLRVLAAGSRFK